MARNDYSSNYLAHHGVLGMKWGIRRYQNPDGSLTEAGKKRYGAESVDKISSAKGLTRRLNDLDQAQAMNKRHQKQNERSSKLMSKLGNKNQSKRLTDTAKSNEGNIKKGNVEKKKLLDKAAKHGYNVIERNINRYAATPSEDMIAYGATVIAGLPGYLVTSIVFSESGTQYSVKEKKEKK